MNDPNLTLFHAPNTRSLSVLTLLEELETPFKVELMDQRGGALQTPEYRAVNPLGKVPALQDKDRMIVTEQVAIILHLADMFPNACLAPAIGDKLRGPYLRWMVFYAACFEPAIVDHAMGREPGRRAMSPYGEYETVMQTLCTALTPGPYLLGETFSAADVLWGVALCWTTQFKVVPETPEIMSYLKNLVDRPAFVRARQRDAAFAAELAG
jgi:glutathione S-transferase